MDVHAVVHVCVFVLSPGGKKLGSRNGEAGYKYVQVIM